MVRRSTPSVLAAALAAGGVALMLLTGCSPVVETDVAGASAPVVSEPAAIRSVPAISAPSGANDTSIPTPDVRVVSLPVVAPASGGSGGGGGSVAVSPTVVQAAAAYARTLFALTNSARAGAGVGRLTWSSCATSAALGRAARALPKKQLAHEPLTFSCKHGWAGENLARHFGTPQQMFDAWMGSPEHRANILRPQFTSIGIGCVAYARSSRYVPATTTKAIGGYVCSQVFLG